MEKRSFGNDHWDTILKYADGEPDPKMADRATVLVLGSILEQGLELAILSHCVLGWNTPEAEKEQKRLFGGSDDGAMTFAVKIRLAFALGVFGPRTRNDIDMIRRIRIFFAHDRSHLTFDDPDVVELCAQIKWVDDFPWGGVVGKPPTTARDRYTETVRYYFPMLTVGVGEPISYSGDPIREEMFG
jgi:hypothetical protein